VTEERRDGVLILALTGRLGEAGAGRLTEAFDAAIDANHIGFVIDLAGVDYLSSPGLVAIQTAVNRLAERRGVLVLCALSDSVQIALDLAGLSPGLLIERSREDAVSRVASIPS
jgi:anti-anti-sigma factor